MKDSTILSLMNSNESRSSSANTTALVAIIVSVAVMMFVTLLFVA